MKTEARWQPVLSCEHIKRIRKLYGETQSNFAKRLGVDAVTVARWETGQRKCSGHNATAIARLDLNGNPLVKDFIDSRTEFADFSDCALKAVLFAQAETHRQGHLYIGTEHLLLGMLAEGRGTAAGVLRKYGAHFGHAEVSVEMRNGTGPYAIYKEKPLSARMMRMLDLSKEQARFHILNFGIEYSANAQALIESAAAQSKNSNRKIVETGHLLLALLKAEGTAGHEILTSMGVDLAQLKIELIDRTAMSREEDLQEAEATPKPSPAIATALECALQELREAVEMSFLAQKYELAMSLRQQELELWKTFVRSHFSASGI